MEGWWPTAMIHSRSKSRPTRHTLLLSARGTLGAVFLAFGLGQALAQIGGSTPSIILGGPGSPAPANPADPSSSTPGVGLGGTGTGPGGTGEMDGVLRGAPSQ